MASLIQSPIEDVADVGSVAAKIIGLFEEDPTVKAQLSQQIDETALQGQISEVLAQIQVDAVEAANKSIFVSGWRPWVGWVGGTALGTPFLIYVIQSLVLIVHSFKTGVFVPLPPPDTTTLITALGSILGLGGMRTYEKVNNASAPGNIGH